MAHSSASSLRHDLQTLLPATAKLKIVLFAAFLLPHSLQVPRLNVLADNFVNNLRHASLFPVHLLFDEIMVYFRGKTTLLLFGVSVVPSHHAALSPFMRMLHISFDDLRRQELVLIFLIGMGLNCFLFQ
jgi:hypothetical protein